MVSMRKEYTRLKPKRLEVFGNNEKELLGAYICTMCLHVLFKLRLFVSVDADGNELGKTLVILFFLLLLYNVCLTIECGEGWGGMNKSIRIGLWAVFKCHISLQFMWFGRKKKNFDAMT